MVGCKELSGLCTTACKFCKNISLVETLVRLLRDLNEENSIYKDEQQFAKQLCSSSFVPLSDSRHHHAAALGLLCKLLDGTCREHLQMFCPAFLSSVSLLRRSQCLNLPRLYLLINPITATSLDLFCRSFLGCIADIWNNVQLDHIRSSVCQSWTVLLRKMQNVICTV